MDHVLRCVSPSTQSVAETQTDIIAVQTPVDSFCVNANTITRPNFLPLSNSCTNQNVKIMTANATTTSSSDIWILYNLSEKTAKVLISLLVILYKFSSHWSSQTN